MKLIAVLVVVAAFAAVALAVPHHKEGHEGTSCDYHCEGEKALDKPLSTSNGTCRKEFVNECELEMYNCVNHPEKQFEKQSEDKKSADKPLPLCPEPAAHEHPEQPEHIDHAEHAEHAEHKH